MRRKDRELRELKDILEILDKCEVLRLGLAVENRPYIVPLNFGYTLDQEKVTLYAHCATQGRKIDMIKQNSNVCFEVDTAYKRVEGDIACEWSAEFESVIGEGHIQILEENEQKIEGLDVLMRHCGFKGKPHYEENMLKAVTVLKISIDTISGKRKA